MYVFCASKIDVPVRTVGKVVVQIVHHQVRLNILNGMVVVVQPRLVLLPNVGRVGDAWIVKELAPDPKGAGVGVYVMYVNMDMEYGCGVAL